MQRLRKLVKWFLTAALVLIAARTATNVPVHESVSPIFCAPLLDGCSGGGDDGYELIGGFGG